MGYTGYTRPNDEREPTRSSEPRFFSDTLSEKRTSRRYVLSAPLGLAVHGIVLATITITSMLAVPEHTAPNAPATILLRFAPPPPPPPTLLRGASLGPTVEATPIEASVVQPTPSFVIPDEMLTPVIPIDVAYGHENGFDDGGLQGVEGLEGLEGMMGGMPGGVVGGVPGGLVGGVIGGTGSDLPKFPTPDVGPRPLRMPPASYTEDAIREKVRGSVKLRVVIDAQGKVQVLEVLHSIPELDAEAIHTVETSWRFEPAMKNGRPVACLSDLVVRFNLY